MLRSHIASFVIGTVLVGGGAGAATISGITAQGEGKASVTAEVENHLQTAEDAFAEASMLSATGDEGIAKARSLFEGGTDDLLDAVEGADAQVSSGAEAGLDALNLVARTSAELTGTFKSSAGAQVNGLVGVKEGLIQAIDKQIAAAQKLEDEQRASVVATLEAARAELTNGTSATVAPSGAATTNGTTSNVDGSATASGRTSTRTGGTTTPVPATPAVAPAPQPVSAPQGDTSAEAEAHAGGNVSVGGIVPLP